MVARHGESLAHVADLTSPCRTFAFTRSPPWRHDAPCQGPVIRLSCQRWSARSFTFASARKSRPKKIFGLPTQLAPARTTATGTGYKKILERFHEEGESAKTTDRSQLQRAVEVCRTHKGKVHLIIMYDLTRFARENAARFALRAHLR